MTEQGDPVEFLGWIVNTLHRDLGGTKKRNSSIIYSAFQGKVQIQTQQIITHKEYSRPVFEPGRGENRRLEARKVEVIHAKTKCRYHNPVVTILIPCTGPARDTIVPGPKRKEDHSTSTTFDHPGQIRWENNSGMPSPPQFLDRLLSF